MLYCVCTPTNIRWKNNLTHTGACFFLNVIFLSFPLSICFCAMASINFVARDLWCDENKADNRAGEALCCRWHCYIFSCKNVITSPAIKLWCMHIGRPDNISATKCRYMMLTTSNLTDTASRARTRAAQLGNIVSCLSLVGAKFTSNHINVIPPWAFEDYTTRFLYLKSWKHWENIRWLNPNGRLCH